MLNSALNALYGLLFWIVVARAMSPEDIGLATASISAATLIIALSRLGLDQGLVRYLPTVKEKNGFYSAIVMFTLALALIITGIFILSLNFFSPALFFLVKEWVLPVFIAYIILMSIYSIQNITLIALRRSDLAFLQNVLLGVRIPAIFYLAPMGVIGVFYSFGTAFLLAVLFSVLVLSRFKLSISRNLDMHSIKKTLNFSLGNYSAGIFTMAPTTIIPIMIVNTIGAEEGAYFYIAYSVAAILFMIPYGASTSLFVEGSHNLPLKENVLKAVKLIFVILIPSLIIIFIFGEKFLLLFSTEYSNESFEMLLLLAASSIFSSITSIFISIKKVQKDMTIINYLNFILSALIIGVGYIALLKYGLLGIGYAWLGANIAIATIVLGLMRFKERWR